MARIVYRDENYQTFYVDVNAQQTEITIGRNPGNKVLIPTKSLSRYHAKIVYQNGRYFLYDLKSSNGTFVNNTRVTQQEIKPGDKLRFGDVNVDFVDESRVGSISMAGNPQVTMPPACPRPTASVPSSPAAPKLNAPMLQMPQHNSGADLRSVNMRPITSQGTYRPTMPNQPIFDDEMAKVAASQLASPSSNSAGLSASAAPMTFNPNSMGLMPGGNRSLMGGTPPNSAPQLGGAPQNPNVNKLPAAGPMNNGVLDAAAAPMGFSAASMGYGAADNVMTGIPGPGHAMGPSLSPAVPKNKGPASSPAGGLDPSLAPSSFDPMSMGFSPSGRGTGMPPASSPFIPSSHVPSASSLPGSGDTMNVPQPFGAGGLTVPSAVSMPSGSVQNMVKLETGLDSIEQSEQETPAQQAAQMPETGMSPLSIIEEISEESAKESQPQAAEEKQEAENVILPNAEAEMSNMENRSSSGDLPHASRRRATHDGMSVDGMSSVSRRAVRPGGFGRMGNPNPSGLNPCIASSASGSAQSSAGMPAVPRKGRAVGRPRASALYSPRTAETMGDNQFADSTAPVESGPVSASNESAAMMESSNLNDQPFEITDSSKVSESSQAQAPVEENEPKSQIVELSREAAGFPGAESDIDNPADCLPSDISSDKSEIQSLIENDSDDETPEQHPEMPETAVLSGAMNLSPEIDSSPVPAIDDIENADALEAPELVPAYESSDAHQNEIEALKINQQNQLDELTQAHQKAMDALKAEYQKQIDEYQKQIEELRTAQEQEIDALNISHTVEMGELENRNSELKQQLSDAEERAQAAMDAVENLQIKLADTSKAEACAAFVPKWVSRFRALLQYCKAFERAIDKLGIDEVEPKSVEYVRSMTDMIHFCADDLEKL